MKKKILIVEDNPAINRVLLLLNYRYETIPAINGKHAGDERFSGSSPDPGES